MIEYGCKVKLGILPDDPEVDPIVMHNIIHNMEDGSLKSSILQLLSVLFAASLSQTER